MVTGRWGQERRDQLLLASRQGGGATDDVQDVVVVKTEDEPLGAGEGAGDGADDDGDGVAVAVFEPVPGTAPVGLFQALGDDALDAEMRSGVRGEPFPGPGVGVGSLVPTRFGVIACG